MPFSASFPSRTFPKAGSRTGKRQSGWALGALLLLSLGACGEKEEAQAPEIRPVRTIVADSRVAGDDVVLTGAVEAQNEATYGFRVGGRIIERRVNVGDRIRAGQVLARLDPQNEQNALRSAQAALSAANATLSQTRNAYDRQRQLLSRGFTPRANYEAAEQAFLTARSQVEDAEAQVRLAQDRLGFTELKAEAAGTVTARRAEPGEVVQAGQAVVVVARQNGRDAVFDVPANVLRSVPGDPEVQVTLTDDPSVRATGRVREVAPQADPVTRTFQVRVGLNNPPAALRLGSTVTGRVVVDRGSVIEIPASALTRLDGQPAVWVVDPQAHTVALRQITVLQFTPAAVTVAEGIKPSEIIVTAGVQALHPGQKVRLLGAAQ